MGSERVCFHGLGRAKRASKASERSSLVLLALVPKVIFGRLNSMLGLVNIFMFFWWFLACFLLFCFFSRVLARGGERSSPVLLALVLELIFGCLSSMPGLVSMFLYIGITYAEISYIKLGLSLAFSCSPLPDLIYHVGTCLKNDRASRSLLRQVIEHPKSNVV